MAKLGGTFDATGVEPNAPLEALPPGDYKVQILQSEMRVTKAGTGQMLWLDMEVLEGPLQGRHVYDQLNLINPNPTAEEIAQRTLSAICHAVGKLQVADSEELHFLPMLVRVAVQPNGYNEVKGYKPVQQATQPLPDPGTGTGYRPGGPPSARRQPPRRRRPGRGALDPEEGSAVADRVWRHGGDGAFPTGIRRTSMEDRTLVPVRAAGKAELPATRAACRAAIDQLRGDIDAIKAQIAAADLERQAKRGKMDPRWYHRARTAIRHKRQQIAALTAHLQTLPADRQGRVQGLPDRGPARRVRRRGLAGLPRPRARAARPAGRRLMAPLPPRASPTVEAILAAYEADAGDGFREHLGASVIGRECDRALWYEFRWITRAAQGGRMLRLFETGRLEEERLIRNLRRIGVTVLDVDPDTGRQWHVQAHGGHFGGSLDGVGLGIPEAPKTWHVLEFKTHNARSFAELKTARGPQGEARALGADAGLHASDRAHPGALPRRLQGHRRALRRAGAGRPRRGGAADRARRADHLRGAAAGPDQRRPRLVPVPALPAPRHLPRRPPARSAPAAAACM